VIKDLVAEDYPEVAIMVLEAGNIQVQHHPNPSRSDTQAAYTAEDDTLEPSNDAIAAGDGHSNG
jgi:hypothetical protein